MTSNGQSGTAEAGSILDRPRTTVTGARQVLFLVHTMTSANRLSDLVSTFEGDFRVELFFSCPRGSTLPTGVREHLQGHGVTPMDWSTVLLRRWDLIISANHSADLETLNGPLITLSHGVGYSKIITRNRKPETGNRKPETGNRKPETGLRVMSGVVDQEWSSGAGCRGAVA